MRARLLVVLAALLAACNGSGGAIEQTPTLEPTAPLTSTVTVSTPITPTEPPDPAITVGPDAATALLIDAEPALDGVQESVQTQVGGTFDVGVVFEDPAARDVSGFAFVLQYDTNVLVAESLPDAPSIDANPDLDQASLGPAGPSWECVPQPEGDLDDPGGVAGDGNDASGQAFLSCFAPGAVAPGGSLVLARVRFTAVGAGTSVLRMSSATIADATGAEFAGCESMAPPARCVAATVTVS